MHDRKERHAFSALSPTRTHSPIKYRLLKNAILVWSTRSGVFTPSSSEHPTNVKRAYGIRGDGRCTAAVMVKRTKNSNILFRITRASNYRENGPSNQRSRDGRAMCLKTLRTLYE
jgi:hypothetical protein